MNFIFDIGNVLVDYKPVPFLCELLNNEQQEKQMLNLIFKSPEWLKLDEGALTHDEACEIFCQKEPEYKELIIKVMNKIPDMLTPMEDTVALLSKIKEQGHKLYYLSNYHIKLSAHIINKYSFFELFDGGVFSCDVHTLKPDHRIYEHLLDKYNLNPAECVFFDDTEVNIAGAQELGINGVLFTDAGDVEKCI